MSSMRSETGLQRPSLTPAEIAPGRWCERALHLEVSALLIDAGSVRIQLRVGERQIGYETALAAGGRGHRIVLGPQGNSSCRCSST